MLTAVVTMNGCNLLTCTPEIFLKDEDFVRVMKSKELAKSLVTFFKKPVCIGRLGVKEREDMSLYKEILLPECNIEVEDGEGALSYYEQIS